MTTGLTHRDRGGRRAPTAPVVLAVLSLLLGSLLVVLAVRGQTPEPPAPASSTASPVPPPGAPAAHPDAQTAVPAQTEEDRAPDPTPASVPTRLRIPAIEVTSPLHALGLAADGTLQVPSGDRYDEAAWYSGSPTPGEVGPTVLEGHVTGPGGRPSIFFELGALQPGDLVEVDREDGSTVTFEVYRTERYAKDDFPTVAVYGPTSGAELRLITCGGEFDDLAGHHLDNTVVYARALVPTT